MKMSFDLNIEQSQKLIMTPQLQQAIQILQFNSLELEKYIREELEKNPVLEETIDKEEFPNTKSEENKIEEINWKEYIGNLSNYGYSKGNYYNEDNELNYENIISKKITLQEHLSLQCSLNLVDKKHVKIGKYIINSIDDSGYFKDSIKNIADYFKEKESVIEYILKVIQTFDPPGVGARTLEECLLIQLDILNIEDKKIYKLIQNHLLDIASNKYPYIAKELGVDVEKIQKYCDFIKTLEPKPGRRFASSENRYIIPDIIVKKVGSEYIISNNDYSSPKLIIRNDYREIINSNDKDSEVNKFLNSQLTSASWLIKSIEQRKQTIYKVCQAIIKRQIDFFEKGKEYLKAMTLKEVADEIGVHESTVSRATNGKYMETPLGTFELKYFFSKGVEMNSGKEISSESVKVMIQDIITKEDCKKPLSDEKIVGKLKNRGINISRRTIAKYREQLGILSSQKRKRY